MHRCLLILEILRVICEQVDSYHNQRRDLRAVALVSRDFYNVSLGILWRRINGLHDLLKILPSDIWSGHLTRRKAVLARAITPSDLGRLRAHAQHVRVYNNNSTDVSITIYQALNFHFHHQSIFPNLVELCWMNNDMETFPYITTFLGPHIRKIHLRVSGDSVQHSLLPTLGERCPSLVHFNLYTADHHPDTGRQMKFPLSQWSQLETLYIQYLPEESLQIVAGLPCLRRLALARADDRYGDSFSPTPGTPVFPALENLSIIANSPTLCVNLLEKAATNSIPLEKFRFSLFGLNPPVWRRLLAALAESCNKHTLTRVRIDDLAVKSGEWGPGTTDDLQLLLPFTGLTHVSLQTCHGFGIDNAFVRKMAAAWPRIRELDLGATKIHQHPLEQQQLTLDGLVPLVELCPELQKLKVHVNATHACSNYFDLCSGSQTRVTLLHVGSSPISEASIPWVAAYLSSIFPELHTMQTHDYGDEEEPPDLDRWSEVSRHLIAYRHVSGRRRNDSRCPQANCDAM